MAVWNFLRETRLGLDVAVEILGISFSGMGKRAAMSVGAILVLMMVTDGMMWKALGLRGW